MTEQLAFYLCEYHSYGDSQFENEQKQAVWLFGRDPVTKKKKIFKKVFEPYFYITQSKWSEIARSDPFKVKRAEGSFVRTLDKRAVTKITLFNPLAAEKIQNYIKRMYKTYHVHTPVYELDMAKITRFPQRFLIDMHLKSGVTISQDESGKYILTPTDLICPLRVWIIDFEWVTELSGTVSPERDDPICMVTVYDSYDNEYVTVYVKDYDIRKTAMHKFVSSIIRVNTEEELIWWFLEHLRDKDPDLLTGWNLVRADIRKLRQRMKKYSIELRHLSPRMGRVNFKSWPPRIKGLILFDMMKAYLYFTSKELESYSLGFVASKEKLSGTYKPFKGSPLKQWKEHPERTFSKNVMDVKFVKLLNDKYDLIGMFDTRRREFGMLFHEVFLQHRVIDTELLRFVNKRIALPSSKIKVAKGGSFKGGVVVEPDSKPYRNIAQLDFSRMYPRFIKKYNISPETFRWVNGHHRIEADNVVLTFAKSPIGVMPQLVDRFFKMRDAYELFLKQAIKKGDETEIKMWKQRVWVIKQSTNAIFGVTDYEGFRLYKKECSQAIALFGREAIEWTIKELRRIGYTVLYGDTDSIFIQLYNTELKKQIEEIKMVAKYIRYFLFTELGQKLHKIEGKLDESPYQLSPRRIYSDYFPLTKKRYIGKYTWDEKRGFHTGYDIKGAEAIRTDASKLEKKVTIYILKMIVDRKTIKDGKAYWVKVQKDFWRKKMDPLEISYPTGIKKRSIQDYKKTLPAHIKASIYSNFYLGTDFRSGDKPRRLSIKQKNPSMELFGKTTFPWGKKTYKLKDIAIDEYTKIPKPYLDSIDWDRIFKRLEGKVKRLFERWEKIK